jgi:hypothetical protein
LKISKSKIVSGLSSPSTHVSKRCIKVESPKKKKNSQNDEKGKGKKDCFMYGKIEEIRRASFYGS